MDRGIPLRQRIRSVVDRNRGFAGAVLLVYVVIQIDAVLLHIQLPLGVQLEDALHIVVLAVVIAVLAPVVAILVIHVYRGDSLVKRHAEIPLARCGEIRIGVPSDQLISGALGNVCIDVRIMNRFAVVQTERQALIVGKLDLIVVGVVPGRYQHHSHAVGVPLGVDRDILVRHGLAGEVIGHLAVRILIPAGKEIAIPAVGRRPGVRSADAVAADVRAKEDTFLYLLHLAGGLSTLRNEVDVVRIRRVTEEDVLISISNSGCRCYISVPVAFRSTGRFIIAFLVCIQRVPFKGLAGGPGQIRLLHPPQVIPMPADLSGRQKVCIIIDPLAAGILLIDLQVILSLLIIRDCECDNSRIGKTCCRWIKGYQCKREPGPSSSLVPRFIRPRAGPRTFGQLGAIEAGEGQIAGDFLVTSVCPLHVDVAGKRSSSLSPRIIRIPSTVDKPCKRITIFSVIIFAGFVCHIRRIALICRAHFVVPIVSPIRVRAG